MIGDKFIFSFFTPRKGRHVSYGDNNKGNIWNIYRWQVLQFNNWGVFELMKGL